MEENEENEEEEGEGQMVDIKNKLPGPSNAKKQRRM